MRAWVVVVLMASLLLVQDAEAGWVRRAWRRYVKPALVNAAITAVVAGKRDVTCPDQLNATEIAEIAEDLQKSCAEYPIEGVTRKEVESAFDKFDENGDDALMGEEFAEFEKTIEFFEICMEVEAANKK